jgi:hypothetical protein
MVRIRSYIVLLSGGRVVGDVFFDATRQACVHEAVVDGAVEDSGCVDALSSHEGESSGEFPFVGFARSAAGHRLAIHSQTVHSTTNAAALMQMVMNMVSLSA